MRVHNKNELCVIFSFTSLPSFFSYPAYLLSHPGSCCSFFQLFQSMTLACPSVCCTLYAVALCKRKKNEPPKNVFSITCKRKGSGRGMEKTKKDERRSIRHENEHFRLLWIVLLYSCLGQCVKQQRQQRRKNGHGSATFSLVRRMIILKDCSLCLWLWLQCCRGYLFFSSLLLTSGCVSVLALGATPVDSEPLLLHPFFAIVLERATSPPCFSIAFLFFWPAQT